MTRFNNSALNEIVAHANAGDLEAQISAAQRFLKQGHYDGFAKARIYLVRAAEQGDIESQFSVGNLYRDPAYGQPDLASAARWLASATANQHVGAALSLCQLAREVRARGDREEMARVIKAAEQPPILAL